MYKLSHLVDGEWREHSHPPVFSVGSQGDQVQRVIAGSPSGDTAAFERLVRVLEPPYFLLYVLHTPRGEAEPGRYQSPELSVARFQTFMEQFGVFLSSDSRYDIWAYSPSERATVVWDRHNQLFAYGPRERFVSELVSMGFSPGVPSIDFPHQHHYRHEYDQAASELLRFLEWSRSPLRQEDEQ